MHQKRVVITGMGIVSPLGNSREETWAHVCAGDSGAAPITQFDASTWPTTFACEVKDFIFPDGAMLKELRPYLSRPSEFGAAAALEAMDDAGISDYRKPQRFGVCLGAGIGTINPHHLARLLRGMSLKPGLPDLAAKLEESQGASHLVLQNHPGTLAGLLAQRYKARGPVTTIHTACASSGQAIGQAYQMIRRGDADVMLSGGADSLAGELLLAGFCLLGALSKRNDAPKEASRPFDKGRDGFVASEGAAMLILEERDHALARGAKIYGEIVGYGETESAYRITDLPPDGRGIVEAMHLAVKESGLGYEAVSYINAHGTSTELNDRIEALAMRRVFLERGARPAVSSTKSETGHLISAAGALEFAFCALAVRDDIVPPNRNLESTDCGDDIDFVRGEARRMSVRAALSNSIGFGGSNSSLLVAKAI